MFFNNLRHSIGTLMLILIISSCGGKANEVTPEVIEKAQVMFYNGGSTESYYALNDKKVTDPLGLATSSNYVSIEYTPTNVNAIKLKSSTGADVISQAIIPKNSGVYSFFTWRKPLTGGAQTYGSIMVEDSLSAPATGKVKIRAAIMNRDGGAAYDIIAADANQNQTKIFENVSLGNVTSFKEMNAGTYRFTFFGASGSFNFGNVQNIKLEAGKIYTLATSNKIMGSIDVSADLITNK